MPDRRSCFPGSTSFTFAALTLLVCACSPPAVHDGGTDSAVPADMGTDTPVSLCTNDQQCSDGVFCNGAERCMPGAANANAHGCIAAIPTNPCMPTQTCNEAMQRCETSCPTTADADHDGHRSIACGGDDCDDSDPNRFPGNVEGCDAAGHDEDCDPMTIGNRDADGDGEIDARCCNDVLCGTDCDDSRPNVGRHATEVCNGIDDNCNGMTDEGVLITYRRDADGDGFANPAGEVRTGCSAPSGYSDTLTDCDERAATATRRQPRCATASITTATE